MATKGGEGDRVQTTWGNDMNIVQKARLKKAFQIFDKDGNGKIDKKEMVALLAKMGNQDTRGMTEADAQSLIDDFDDNVRCRLIHKVVKL